MYIYVDFSSVVFTTFYVKHRLILFVFILSKLYYVFKKCFLNIYFLFILLRILSTFIGISLSVDGNLTAKEFFPYSFLKRGTLKRPCALFLVFCS